MKKALSFLTLLFFVSVCSSQIQIADSITKLSIPFAAISYNKIQDGFYSDENGKINGVELISDSIMISCIGYNSLKLDIDSLKDTIFLSPKPESLSEVIVTYRVDNVKKSIGSLKKSSDLSWQIVPKQEFITIVNPSVSYTNAYLKEIQIPINKTKGVDKNQPTNNKGYARINIYSIKNSMPDEKIFSSVPIEYFFSKKNTLKVDLSEEFISYNQSGFCIGVEFIGLVEPNGKMINNKQAYMELKFTHKKTRDFSSETYYKNVFGKGKLLIPLDSIVEKHIGLRKHYALILGMAVEIRGRKSP